QASVVGPVDDRHPAAANLLFEPIAGDLRADGELAECRGNLVAHRSSNHPDGIRNRERTGRTRALGYPTSGNNGMASWLRTGLAQVRHILLWPSELYSWQMTIGREVSSPALVVRTQGFDRSLEPGRSYSIGRNPESDIVVEEARVS